MSSAFERVRARLGVSAASGNRFSAKCPAHDDKHPSLSVGLGTDGRVLLYCHAGCPTEAVVAALGLTMADLFADPSRRTSHSGTDEEGTFARDHEHSDPAAGNARTPQGLTLPEYATAKGLDEARLRAEGVEDQSWNGTSRLRISYRDTNGVEKCVRYRTADALWWKLGGRLIPYGLPRLSAARTRGVAILVEGESDCHTLWQHDQPAFGVPGGTNWKQEWAAYFEDIKHLVVVAEPDKGGTALVKSLAQSTLADRLRVVTLGEHKDPSDLYLADRSSFPQKWSDAVERAVPLRDFVKTLADADRPDEAALLAKCRHLLEAPDILEQVGQLMQKHFYAGDCRTPKLAYVTLTSRLLDTPINLVIVAPSAAGKNRAVFAALQFVPDNAIYRMSAGSERSLIYTDASFAHVTLIIDEGDSLPEDGAAASAVRAILSDNRMVYAVVEEGLDGRNATRHVVKEGPTGIITTSTRPLATQFSTRHLEDTVSDTPEQTRTVMKRQAERVASGELSEPDLSAFHALQDWLCHYGEKRVVVPFAGALAHLVSDAVVRHRRDFPQLLTVIQTVALLHQLSRERNSAGAVVATLDDYRAARELVLPLFAASTSEGVTDRIRETVAAVPEVGETGVNELAATLKLSKSTVSDRVSRAVEKGFLLRDEKTRKVKRGDPLPDRVEPLPTVEQVEAFGRSGPTEKVTTRVASPSSASASPVEAFGRSVPTEAVTTRASSSSSPWADPVAGGAATTHAGLEVGSSPLRTFLDTLSLCSECSELQPNPEVAGYCANCGRHAHTLTELFDSFAVGDDVRSAVVAALEGCNETPDDLPTFVADLLEGKSSPPGFGHRLLRHLDHVREKVDAFKVTEKRKAAAAKAAVTRAARKAGGRGETAA